MRKINKTQILSVGKREKNHAGKLFVRNRLIEQKSEKENNESNAEYEEIYTFLVIYESGGREIINAVKDDKTYKKLISYYT